MLPSGIPLPTQAFSDAATYTDFSGLAALRARARKDAAGTLEAVASQFESMFISMMLKSMRSTTHGDALLGSGGKLFTDLFDQQIALDISKTNRFGLAEVLVRQLKNVVAPPPVNTGESAVLAARPVSNTAPVAQEQRHETRAQAGIPSPVTPLNRLMRNTAPGAPPTRTEQVPDSPLGFVKAVWRHANQAAQAMGVDPKVLVAQAALETGWGRSVIQDRNGNSSNNLFGIKADTRWRGPSAEVSTIEYNDGVLSRVRAPFRVYTSVAESFSDYITFIQGQPRYSEAVANAKDPEKYLRALQDAGYATDPHYANKILSIFKRKELNEWLHRVPQSEVDDNEF